MRNSIINDGFVKLIKANFDESEHRFMVWGKGPIVSKDETVVLLKYPFHLLTFYHHLKLNLQMYKASSVILHGLTNPILVVVLFTQQWLLEKCYWIMWGGDFYYPEKRNFFRRKVLKKIKHFVTGVPGDYELVKKWYGSNGEFIYSLAYPSNLFKQYEFKPQFYGFIHVQVGNSADPSNNHSEVFEKLKDYKNILIFCPLSYGDRKYARKVVEKGRALFGDRFKPLLGYLSFDDYLDFLASIDIAVFNHKRQQAFGNIVSLLGFGKKVYLNRTSTLNSVFEDFGIQVYDSKCIDLCPLDNFIKNDNIEKVERLFSEESLIKSLKLFLS
jgi:hypothetical protein